MFELKNNRVKVKLDGRYPRIISFSRLDSGGIVCGCSEEVPFLLELNNRLYHENEFIVSVHSGDNYAEYGIMVPSLSLTLDFRFTLEEETVLFQLQKVTEKGDFRLVSLYLPEHRLATGTAKNGDSYLRNCSGTKTNWSRHWCPGVDWSGWEDYGLVGGGTPERGVQRTGNACIWNDGICIAIASSIYSNPFISVLGPEGQLLEGRAGRFSVWSDTCYYRLAGKTARPFEIRIGVLGDYNRNGKVDWCDGAAWVGDRGVHGEYPYRETILYKIYVDDARAEFPIRTFKECLEIIKQIHTVSGGIKQIAYLVGWQHQGHDTGYPDFGMVNERLGGLEGLWELMLAAQEYNCIVSLHTNLDDSYEGNPGYDEEILSRDAEGNKYGWFFNFENGGKSMYSINHTLAVETGFERDRLEKLLKLLPVKESIHFDAFRPNETWLHDGTHISMECEIQQGMLPIREMYLEKGIDITTEGIGGGPHGLYKWGWHMAGWRNVYGTVMAHGRAGGYHRTGLEGEALGKWFIWTEKEMDTYEETVRNFFINWMYAQILFRKKMVDYKIGAWNEGVEAWYDDNTYVRSARGGHRPQELEAWYEGILIARGNERFLPWRENIIYFYSDTGGHQEWMLPSSWVSAGMDAYVIRRSGKIAGPKYSISGRNIRFTAPKGYPVMFVRKMEPVGGGHYEEKENTGN